MLGAGTRFGPAAGEGMSAAKPGAASGAGMSATDPGGPDTAELTLALPALARLDGLTGVHGG